MKEIYVVGFGNLLMSDDGVGIRVAQAMAEDRLPAGVSVVDGGVSSLEVLGPLLAADKVIIVDALTGGGEPGTVYRLTPADLADVQGTEMFSLHDFSLPQTLALLSARAKLPPMVIYGVEPAAVAMGLELTPAVAVAAARVRELILAELGENTDA
jgi:hydrogenase maturation protease